MPARIVDESHIREGAADIDPDPPRHAASSPFCAISIVDWMVGTGQAFSAVGRRASVAIMTHVLHRQIGQSYPSAASGQGIVIRDSHGNEYIDASSGAAVSCLGHSHPDVLAAMRDQLDRLAYAHTSFFTTWVAEELADDLVAHAPQGMRHVLFVSGGSEAIEAALKLARQYFVERGEPGPRY